MTVIILLMSVVGLMLLRVPVAFALLIPSAVYIVLSDTLSWTMVIQRVTGGIDSFALLAVPLFVTTGVLANQIGATDRLFTFATNVLGHIRGSLGYVNVLTSLVFSWMSGAAVSDVAALGRMSVVSMVKRGYQPRFSAGLTGSASLIGSIMPPSIPAIIYAVSAGVSVGAMFMAGIVPALIIVVVLSIVVFLHSRKRSELKLPRAEFRKMFGSGLLAAPMLLTPVIIIGGILFGVFTPTEAAGIAVIYLTFLGFVSRKLPTTGIRNVLRTSVESTGAIMLIVGAASLFGWVLTSEGAPRAVAAWLTGITDSPTIFMLVVVAAFLALGTFLEPTSAILILVPVLGPVASTFGINPIHFGTVMIFGLMIGLITPPVGLVLFVLTDVTDVNYADIVRGVALFLGPLILILLAVALIPTLTLWHV